MPCGSRAIRLSAAVDIEPTLAVSVTPGLRPEPQPLRVLHNGRFSLPAGRYRVVVRWATRDPLPAGAGSAIALQVGRIGPALQEWQVTPVPAGEWTAEFWLPADAGFVGFRGSIEVERSIAELRIEALDIVDAGVRTTTPQVLAAAAYHGTLVLFHDEAMYPGDRRLLDHGAAPRTGDGRVSRWLRQGRDAACAQWRKVESPAALDARLEP